MPSRTIGRTTRQVGLDHPGTADEQPLALPQPLKPVEAVLGFRNILRVEDQQRAARQRAGRGDDIAPFGRIAAALLNRWRRTVVVARREPHRRDLLGQGVVRRHQTGRRRGNIDDPGESLVEIL